MVSKVQWQADKGSSRHPGIVAISAEDTFGPVPAVRTEFKLSPEDWQAWDVLQDRPARDIPELRELMAKPSPFFVD